MLKRRDVCHRVGDCDVYQVHCQQRPVNLDWDSPGLPSDNVVAGDLELLEVLDSSHTDSGDRVILARCHCARIAATCRIHGKLD